MPSFVASSRYYVFAALIAILMFVETILPASAASFLRAMDDIPLPQGLVETANIIEFDTPYGRIVESAARGEVEIDAAEHYYAASLPSLGWSVSNDGNNVYVRGEETLYLNFSKVDEQVSVHYRLVVHPAPSIMNE